MQRNNLLVALGVIVVGASLWFLKSAFDYSVNVAQPVTTASAAPRAAAAEPRLERVPAPGATTAKALPSASGNADLEALQNQLLQEQNQLQAQKQTLANLQSQQAQVPPPTQYSSQMNQHQDQIQELTDELRDTQNQEDRVQDMAQTSLQVQQLKAEQTRSQLDESLRAQQEALVQTQNLIAAWPNPNTGVNDVQGRLAELQNTLANQQSNLAVLQNQRNDLNSAVFQQADAVSSWSGQAHQDLSGAQDAIQTQIYSLRDEIHRLQSAQGQSRMSVMSLSSQVSQVQKDIDAQNLRVQELQTEIQQKQSSVQR